MIRSSSHRSMADDRVISVGQHVDEAVVEFPYVSSIARVRAEKSETTQAPGADIQIRPGADIRKGPEIEPRRADSSAAALSMSAQECLRALMERGCRRLSVRACG